MPVARLGEKLRHRELPLGDGTAAEVWLAREGANVVLTTEYEGGGGQTSWRRCATYGCLGEALSGHGECFAHSRPDERRAYLDHVTSNGQTALLRGVEITPEVWALIVEHVGEAGVFCTGAVFAFRLTFIDDAFTGLLDLTAAELGDGVEARQYEFARGFGASFVDFGSTAPAYFFECTFRGPIALQYAHIKSQELAFEQCKIDDSVHAVGSIGAFAFRDCAISGDLSLQGANLQLLSMNGTSVEKAVNLDRLSTSALMASRIRLPSATALTGANIQNYCNLSGASFGARIRLDISADDIDLQGANFEHGGRLEAARARIDLQRLLLGGQLTIVGRDGASIQSIDDADAASLALGSVDLSRCVFHRAHGLDGITIESTRELPFAPGWFRTKRRCIADEFAWRARNSWYRRDDWRLDGTALNPAGPAERRLQAPHTVVLPELSAGQVARVYRMLRNSLETRSNQPGAADFYYGEMEMRLRDHTSGWPERLIILLYWLTSGYGLRAFRSLVCLAAVCLLGASVLHSRGFTSRVDFTTAIIASVEGLVPGLPIANELTTAGRATNVALTILGPLLIALFVLALRNRVRR
jgi:hypothetical protein